MEDSAGDCGPRPCGGTRARLDRDLVRRRRGDHDPGAGRHRSEAPVLPDLAPKPQLNVQVQQVGKRWRIRFRHVIVNVGEGDFILRGTRERGRAVDGRAGRPVFHERSEGASRLRSGVVWGGDGHDHWHIVRVASVWLVPLDARRSTRGRLEEVHRPEGGLLLLRPHARTRPWPREGGVLGALLRQGGFDSEFGMGLSPGWNDTYLQSLPGQDIDVTGLPDGKYRLWTEIDEQASFPGGDTGRTTVTWIDLDTPHDARRSGGADASRQGRSRSSRRVARARSALTRSWPRLLRLIEAPHEGDAWRVPQGKGEECGSSWF